MLSIPVGVTMIDSKLTWKEHIMIASYSYRVMVKSISSCIRGRRVISNPVTYSLFYGYSYTYVATGVAIWLALIGTLGAI